MSNKQVIIILYCVIICLVGAFSTIGQEKQTDLKDKQITIKIEKQSVRLIFRYLMANYDIPIGFEESILDRDHAEYKFITNPGESKLVLDTDGSIKINKRVDDFFKPKLYPISIDIENGRLEEVLNQIVKQMQNYKWEINDGVVNILPIKGRDERFKDLLEIKVNSFIFEKGKTVEDITTNIRLLPEFRNFMQENKLVFTGVRNGADFVLKAQYGRTISEGMDFSNLTFCELLNKITKIKKGGWILKWKGISKTTGTEYIDIDI
jgi:hypothetical protein